MTFLAQLTQSFPADRVLIGPGARVAFEADGLTAITALRKRLSFPLTKPKSSKRSRFATSGKCHSLRAAVERASRVARRRSPMG